MIDFNAMQHFFAMTDTDQRISERAMDICRQLAAVTAGDDDNKKDLLRKTLGSVNYRKLEEIYALQLVSNAHLEDWING